VGAGQVVVAAEAVEDGLASHVGCGSGRFALGRFDSAPAQFTCHHAHRFTLGVPVGEVNPSRTASIPQTTRGGEYSPMRYHHR
jgi:hypothetical protein